MTTSVLSSILFVTTVPLSVYSEKKIVIIFRNTESFASDLLENTENVLYYMRADVCRLAASNIQKQ